MSTLADTISNALAAVGPATETRLRDIFAEFGGLSLGEEDRLTVLATTIATVAVTHHARHKSVYLEAVRTWALEISAELQPPPLRLAGSMIGGPIEEGAEILITGVDSLIEAMTMADVGVQDRLVTELALVARLLGQHDANTIHLTLMSVERVLDAPGYRPGDAVSVPLRETARPLTRDVALASLQPRGVA